MNHRMGRRLETSHPVSLGVAGLGMLEARLKNISLSGAAIDCINLCLLDSNTPIELKFQIENSSGPEEFEAEAFVVRQLDSMIGVSFMHEMVDLVQYLKSANPSATGFVTLQRQCLA